MKSKKSFRDELTVRAFLLEFLALLLLPFLPLNAWIVPRANALKFLKEQECFSI